MTDKVVPNRPAEHTESALSAWFAGNGFSNPTVRVLPGPQSTGYSHETIVFELLADGRARRLVARVEPQGERNIFPDPDLHLEYRLLEAISSSGVPLPRLHGFEPDPTILGAPFYVMEHLDGRVPSDNPPYCMGGWLYECTPAERAAVWWSGLEAMSRVHRIDPDGLEFVNAGRTTGFQGELEYWERYIDFCGGIPATTGRAWSWLCANVPSETSTALCWGDSRLGNQIFADGRCVALLDWEMACLSDPVQDLAWFVYFDDVFSSGLGVRSVMPGRDESVARYAELMGTPVRNLDYLRSLPASGSP